MLRTMSWDATDAHAAALAADEARRALLCNTMRNLLSRLEAGDKSGATQLLPLATLLSSSLSVDVASGCAHNNELVKCLSPLGSKAERGNVGAVTMPPFAHFPASAAWALRAAADALRRITQMVRRDSSSSAAKLLSAADSLSSSPFSPFSGLPSFDSSTGGDAETSSWVALSSVLSATADAQRVLVPSSLAAGVDVLIRCRETLEAEGEAAAEPLRLCRAACRAMRLSLDVAGPRDVRADEATRCLYPAGALFAALLASQIRSNQAKVGVASTSLFAGDSEAAAAARESFRLLSALRRGPRAVATCSRTHAACRGFADAAAAAVAPSPPPGALAAAFRSLATESLAVALASSWLVYEAATRCNGGIVCPMSSPQSTPSVARSRGAR